MRFALEIVSATGQVLEAHEFDRKVLTVGRAEGNGLVLRDPLASKTHAEISIDAGRFLLKDLGSRNGTFLNGQRMREPHELADGDIVRIGTTRVRFRAEMPEGGAAGARGAGRRAGETLEFEPPSRGPYELAGEGIERIKEATGRVAAAQDPVTLVEELLADFFELARAEAAEVVLLEPVGEMKPLLRVAVDSRRGEPLKAADSKFGLGTVTDPNAPPLPDARPVAQKLFKERRIVEGSEVTSKAAWSPDRLRELPARLGVPILGGGQLFGYVYVERAAARGAFSPVETARVGIVCDALGAYLRSAFEE